MLLIKRIFWEHKFSSQEFGRHFKNSFFWLFKHTGVANDDQWKWALSSCETKRRDLHSFKKSFLDIPCNKLEALRWAVSNNFSKLIARLFWQTPVVEMLLALFFVAVCWPCWRWWSPAAINLPKERRKISVLELDTELSCSFTAKSLGQKEAMLSLVSS